MTEALRSLIYTSVPSRPLSSEELGDIARKSAAVNALDGLTGLLLFNGHFFVQVLEGSTSAINAAMERISRDARHHSINVIEQIEIPARNFASWDMALFEVGPSWLAARKDLDALLPAKVAPAVRALIQDSLQHASVN